MKSAIGAPATVKKYGQWISRLTAAESVLVPIIPTVLVWAITADQQVREAKLDPFHVAWGGYVADDWIASAVMVVAWAALILAVRVRRRIMGSLASLVEGHPMETTACIAADDSSEIRGRMVRGFVFAIPGLWFVSLVAVPAPAVWQIVTLVAGAWYARGWQQVEKDEAPRIKKILEAAYDTARAAEEKEMFGD